VAIQNKTMSISEYDQIKDLIEAFNLPTKLPKNINVEKLFKIMLLDKKVKNNEMTYVLPKNIGKAYITNKIKKNIVIKALKDHVK